MPERDIPCRRPSSLDRSHRGCLLIDHREEDEDPRTGRTGLSEGSGHRRGRIHSSQRRWHERTSGTAPRLSRRRGYGPIGQNGRGTLRLRDDPSLHGRQRSHGKGAELRRPMRKRPSVRADPIHERFPHRESAGVLPSDEKSQRRAGDLGPMDDSDVRLREGVLAGRHEDDLGYLRPVRLYMRRLPRKALLLEGDDGPPVLQGLLQDRGSGGCGALRAQHRLEVPQSHGGGRDPGEREGRKDPGLQERPSDGHPVETMPGASGVFISYQADGSPSWSSSTTRA